MGRPSVLWNCLNGIWLQPHRWGSECSREEGQNRVVQHRPRRRCYCVLEVQEKG